MKNTESCRPDQFEDPEEFVPPPFDPHEQREAEAEKANAARRWFLSQPRWRYLITPWSGNRPFAPRLGDCGCGSTVTRLRPGELVCKDCESAGDFPKYGKHTRLLFVPEVVKNEIALRGVLAVDYFAAQFMRGHGTEVSLSQKLRLLRACVHDDIVEAAELYSEKHFRTVQRIFDLYWPKVIGEGHQ